MVERSVYSLLDITCSLVYWTGHHMVERSVYSLLDFKDLSVYSLLDC